MGKCFVALRQAFHWIAVHEFGEQVVAVHFLSGQLSGEQCGCWSSSSASDTLRFTPSGGDVALWLWFAPLHSKAIVCHFRCYWCVCFVEAFEQIFDPFLLGWRVLSSLHFFPTASHLSGNLFADVWHFQPHISLPLFTVVFCLVVLRQDLALYPWLVWNSVGQTSLVPGAVTGASALQELFTSMRSTGPLASSFCDVFLRADVLPLIRSSLLIFPLVLRNYEISTSAVLSKLFLVVGSKSTSSW